MHDISRLLRVNKTTEVNCNDQFKISQILLKPKLFLPEGNCYYRRKKKKERKKILLGPQKYTEQVHSVCLHFQWTKEDFPVTILLFSFQKSTYYQCT